ncbi:MAG: phosphate signaling complex protein PhoU [Planctomycetota bacterium]|nr:phosphate signaling complex protein PhoU [Planctomycetota bacterium]
MAVNLQNDIIELRRSLLSMGALVEQRVNDIVDALIDSNLQTADAVRRGDDEIDQMEVSIEAQCMRLLALAHPVATDLRFVLAVIRISGELERIGDLARGIAKRIIKLSQVDAVELPSSLIDLAFGSRTMLSDVLSAMGSEDANLCRQVRRSDQRIDDIHKTVLVWAREEIPKSSESASMAIEFLSIAQRLERIADLASHVADDVIFLIEGRVVRHLPD